MKRIPRPRGLTELKSLNTNDPNNNLYIQHILDHYTNNNFTYCGISIDIEQLANMLNINPEAITDHLIKKGSITYNQLGEEAQAEHLRAILGISLNWALSDRFNALEQYNILKVSQGQTYKPFISSEVTKALKLTQESTSNLLNLYKSLAGNNGLSVIINNTNNTQVNENYLTVDKALELLSEKDKQEGVVALGPSVSNPKMLEGLKEQYDIDNMPEVRANRQEGVNTSKEALSIREIAKLHDGLVNDFDDTQELRHVNRRANELGEDLDADEI